MKNKIKSFILLFKRKKIIPVYVTCNDNILNGRIALITGGTGGIGYAIAKKFVNSGCKVIITGTNEKKLEKMSKDLGDNCKYVVLNLNNVSTFKDVIEKSNNLFGKIDILINNAGIHNSRKNIDFLNFTEKEYDDVMNTNLKGTYFFSQEFSNYMIKNKIKGNILMMSSNRSIEPQWSPYALSKQGINGLTVGMAQKLIKYDIVVNGIAPGPTATAMQDWKEGETVWSEQNQIERYILPEEVAEYAKLLVSSNSVVGDTIYISGGRGIIELR